MSSAPEPRPVVDSDAAEDGHPPEPRRLVDLPNTRQLPDGIRDRQSPIARARRVVTASTHLHSQRPHHAVQPVTVSSRAMPLGLSSFGALMARDEAGQLTAGERGLLERSTRQLRDELARDPAHPHMTAAYLSPKGGTGKSTLALLTADAIALARPGHRVVIVDLDIDGQGELNMRTHHQARPPRHNGGLEDLIGELLNQTPDLDLDAFGYVLPSGARLLRGPDEHSARQEMLQDPRALWYLLPALHRSYDLVLLDLGAGVENKLSSEVRQLADTIVYVTDAEPGVVLRSGALLRELLEDGSEWAKPVGIGTDEPTRLVPVINQMPSWLASAPDMPSDLYASYQEIYGAMGFAPLPIPRSEVLQRAMWLMQYELADMPLLVQMEIYRLAVFVWPPAIH